MSKNLCKRAEEYLKENPPHSLGDPEAGSTVHELALSFITRLVEELNLRDAALVKFEQLALEEQVGIESQLTRMKEMYEAECEGGKKLLDALRRIATIEDDKRKRGIGYDSEVYQVAVLFLPIAKKALGKKGDK